MAFKSYHTMNGQIIGDSDADYILDGLGSVIGTWRLTGTIQNQYRYSGYGQLVHKSGSAADPYFLWVGGWGYRTRGMVYVRRRVFYEDAAVWTSVDEFPYWMFRVTRAYLYSFLNPATVTDPSGLLPRAALPNGSFCGSGCEDPTDPCGFVQRTEHLKQLLPKNTFGFVVCCDGKAIVCNIDPEKWPKGLRKCVDEHEAEHMPFCEKQCKSKTSISICSPEGNLNREECKAYKVEIDCLLREEKADCALQDPIDLIKCTMAYMKRKCSACRNADLACSNSHQSTHVLCYQLKKEICKKLGVTMP